MDCNLATKHWGKRFNRGVLGIICVDAFIFSQQVVGADNRTTSCLEFFGRLADKIIDQQGEKCLKKAAAEQDAGGGGVMDTAATAAPTIRRTICHKLRVKGNHIIQGRCRCKDWKKHSIYVCSVCTHPTNPTQKQFWFCNSMLEGWWRGASVLPSTLSNIYIKCTLYASFSHLTSCCGSHTKTRQSTEYQHDIHGLDVLLCLENDPSGHQGMHHHAKPEASKKHKKCV
jgi:hypothetical protein